MARASADKVTKSFKNGFISEATPLTFPENSCKDIDNCDIEISGTVRRRLGLDQEQDSYTVGAPHLDDTVYSGLGGPRSISDGGTAVPIDQLAITEHLWLNPGTRADLNFIVFQIGNRLSVRNYNSEPVSSVPNIASIVTGSTEFVLDNATTGFVYNTKKSDAAKTPIQASSGVGRLWITSSCIEPCYLEFDVDTSVITLKRVETTDYGTGIRLAIRDFAGVLDGLRAEEEPSTLSDEHAYNLINQGWDSAKWEGQYFDQYSRYPSNAQQWILGRGTDDEFDASNLVNQSVGNSLAPRGHVVIDALAGQKIAHDIVESEEVGTYTVSSQNEKARRSFTAITFYAGRIFLAGDENQRRPNGIYFSKIIQRPEDAAVLCQTGDPTAENFSDLLATDGGVVYIAEADKISRMEPYGPGVLIFAKNGVWFIFGGSDSGFAADSIQVEKVSSTGMQGPSTVVRTEQSVVFWGVNSIFACSLPDSGTIPVVTDLTLEKISSFYNAINPDARANAKGCFDNFSKKVFWCYLDKGSYNYPSLTTFYNAMLILDSRTGAFTKYSFATNDNTDADGLKGIAGIFPRKTLIQPIDLNNPVTVSGVPVTVSGDPVTIGEAFDTSDEFLNSVKVVLANSDTNSLIIAEFNNIMFEDYATIVTFPTNAFESFVVTGDDTIGDLQRDKQATYLHSFFKRTETGFTEDENGFLEVKRPSGCTVRAHWDWQITAAGKRWSRSQKAYRYRRPYVPANAADEFDTGEEVVYSKLKIRGHGRALVLRYDSVANQDFQLLGFSIPYTANGA